MHHDWYIIIAFAVFGTYGIYNYVRYENNRRPH